MKSKISRRSAARVVASSAIAAAAAASLSNRISAADSALGSLKGRVNHSVCKWCYAKVPLEDFCKASKDMGLKSVELLNPSDFPTLKKYDLTCAMVSNPVAEGPKGVKLGGIPKA